MIRGQRMLVTGGAGMVGSAIVDACLERGAREVRIFDNFSRGEPEHVIAAQQTGRCQIIHGDVRDADAVNAACEGVDIVFHQSALRVTRCATEPESALSVMAGGALNVFSAAARANVRKIIAASSGVIYGNAQVLPTPESYAPYRDSTVYGATKIYEEGLLRALSAQYDVPHVILRYANVYGPRCALTRDSEVLVRWMHALASGERITIDGDGSQTADFVYVDDVARANVLAAGAASHNYTLNVGTGTETSVAELARSLMRVMAVQGQPEFGPPRAVNNVARRSLDPTYAESVLGFRATVSLDEGLRRLVAWWRHAQSQQAVA
jgi:UDP-glucose 4-epimerase